MKPEALFFNTNNLPWEERPNAHTGQSYYRKMLVQDPDTGVRINLAHYPAGNTTPWHTHPCAHGMYVLEGTLHTPEGDYGPGCFVWYPEGTLAQHGATQTEGVTVLFITDKAFDIVYAEPGAAPCVDK